MSESGYIVLALLGAVAVGAVLATLGILVGLAAAVRIRRGESPVAFPGAAALKAFAERHVARREQQLEEVRPSEDDPQAAAFNDYLARVRSGKTARPAEEAKPDGNAKAGPKPGEPKPQRQL